MLGRDFAGTVSPAWRDVVLGKYYAAWPFVEYGQFLCLSYTVRESLADTLTFSLAFQTTDKLRHCQDIVHHLMSLAEVEPTFSDAGARAAWMTDPLLTPLRELIERIHSLRDWAEILVALNLVLEPLVGACFKNELLSRVAPLNGDAVTPMLVASARLDTQRHDAFTGALVRLLLADPAHGESNRQLLNAWLRRWTPSARDVARGLQPLFEAPGLVALPFAPAFERVVARQAERLRELGLEAP